MIMERPSGMVIETERLLLRQHRFSDFDAWCAMFSDPIVLRFVGAQPISREDMWNRLLRYTGHWTLFGSGIFAIVDKRTGALLGETGFADFHRGLGPTFDPAPEAAWALVSAAHGKGYAKEAATAAHAWFDQRFAPPRTVCIINPDNTASVALASQLGYRPFGDAQYRNGTVRMFERFTGLPTSL